MSLDVPPARREEPDTPIREDITNCHCGRCHCGHSPEGAPVYALGCCNADHRKRAVEQWQAFAREQQETILELISAPKRALGTPPTVPASPPQGLIGKLADALQERGRKASSGEPLFFDRYNLEQTIRAALAVASTGSRER